MILDQLFTLPFAMQVLFSAMIAILFTQSGLDKIFNYKDELSFYKSHFSKTFLKPTVPLLMIIITILETSAGLVSLLGLIFLLLNQVAGVAAIGALLACLSIISLFLGQRIAKDYSGAATLVPYFLLCAAGLYFCLL